MMVDFPASIRSFSIWNSLDTVKVLESSVPMSSKDQKVTFQKRLIGLAEMFRTAGYGTGE